MRLHSHFDSILRNSYISTQRNLLFPLIRYLFNMKFCVVGAGIVGSSSAVRLKKAFPDAKLDIIAESFSPNTTSDGSGGFWQPHLLRDTPLDSIK